MAWRNNTDESRYSNAELLGWELSLPYMNLPILPSDKDRAEKYTTFLEKAFSKQALSAAVKRMKLGANR